MTLREYMAAELWTIPEMADALGVHQATVHRYLQGARWPNRAMMRRIVYVTGGKVTAQDMLDNRGDPAAAITIAEPPTRQAAAA